VAYAYLGTSAQVSSTATDDGESVTLASYSAIDAIGNRISTGLSSQAYLLVDLHGNVAAAVSPGSDPEYLAGFRYDAFGQTVDAYAGGGAPSIPYRFQGRILQSAEGSTDLYDFGARSYDPSLGVFTSFDTVTGSAQNPLTLNRYLYALGNPATMIDPDGHQALEGAAIVVLLTLCAITAVAATVVANLDSWNKLAEKMAPAYQQAVKAEVDVLTWPARKAADVGKEIAKVIGGGSGTGVMRVAKAEPRVLPLNPPNPNTGDPDNPWSPGKNPFTKWLGRIWSKLVLLLPVLPIIGAALLGGKEPEDTDPDNPGPGVSTPEPTSSPSAGATPGATPSGPLPYPTATPTASPPSYPHVEPYRPVAPRCGRMAS